MKKHITVEEWMALFYVNRRTAIWIMKTLSRKGVGAFKIGRRGWSSRLEQA